MNLTAKDVIKQAVIKGTGGRYFLTIVCGVTFLYATVKGILSPEAITTIITMVFINYFDRKDRQQNGGQQQ